MLQVNNLCVTYGQVIALDGFSRTISKGSIVVFTGPNGAGKSTVLKTMAGLIQPKTGTVSLDNQDITGLCDPRIGIVLQRPVLFSGTVKHNVEYGLKCHGIPRSQHESLSTAALGKVGASELIHRHRTALSGGEIQRIALARTLALNPDVLLLDEPFSHLDTQGAQALLQTLLVLNRSGITLCIATHDIQVAPAMGAEIVTLVHGRETPSVIRNVFRGRSYCAQGIWYVQLSNGQLLEHTQTISGDVAFSVDPDSIIISNAPIKTSARNTLQGKITGLETVSCNEDEIHHEQVQVTIDCGFPMIVNLTNTSVRQLDLRLNTVVYLVFKASALRLCRIRR